MKSILLCFVFIGLLPLRADDHLHGWTAVSTKPEPGGYLIIVTKLGGGEIMTMGVVGSDGAWSIEAAGWSDARVLYYHALPPYPEDADTYALIHAKPGDRITLSNGTVVRIK